MKRRYAILEAPSALGHVAEHLGVERAPGVLLEAGLADGLDARRAGCLPASGYSSVPDPRTKVMNPQPLHDYSISLAGEVEALLGNGEFPVVLGGDCSLLLGTMLALRRRGRYGVLYVDGDADFYQPEVNPLRGAASASDLAFATGRGPDIVCDLEGRRPLVRDDDVTVLACRDAGDRERRGCQPLPRDMLILDRDHVRQAGAGNAARQAVAFLTRRGGPDGFWIHLDADVFDQTIMQSVDDPRPDGLTWDDGIAILRTALASSRAAGLQVAIYNPEIDKDGSKRPRAGRRRTKRARLIAPGPAMLARRAASGGLAGPAVRFAPFTSMAAAIELRQQAVRRICAGRPGAGNGRCWATLARSRREGQPRPLAAPRAGVRRRGSADRAAPRR